ncbi:Hypothetical protein PHPALM_18184, partial [Phytophthora palmivora]
MTQGTEKRVVSRKSEVSDKLSSNAALATTQPKGESAVFMKTIVEEVNKLSPQQRGYVISDVLISLKESLEEDIGGTHQSEVVSSLVFLVGWWAGESEYHIEHLGLYRDYITTVKSYVSRLPRSSQRTALQRLIDSLASAIKQFVALLKPNAGMKVKRVCPTVNMSFSRDVGSVDNSAKRYQSLVRILAAFKKEISVNIRDGYDQRIFKPLNKLFRWLCEDQREPYQLHVYRMFVRAAKQHANQILDADARANFIRILERMSEVITDPSSLKTRKFLTDIRQRAGEVLQKLKRFRGKGLQHSILHNLVAEVARLVDYTTYGWNPRQDLTIRKCVKELKEIIMSLDLKPELILHYYQRYRLKRNKVAAYSAIIMFIFCKYQMDVILAHFSADELRVKCLTAVHDELQHAETQLRPALDALKRTLSVVRASRKMYKAPLVLVDESIEVSKALELLVAACNEIGALICELNRQVSSAGSDTSPSATDDEEDMRAEAKLEVPVKKKAAKETEGGRQEKKCTISVATKAAVIDLSLSDEEENVVVKDEPMKENDHVAMEIEEASVPPADQGGSMSDQEHCEEKQEEGSGPPPRKKARKRMKQKSKKGPKKVGRDVVIRLRKRAEMVPGGDIGETVGSALNAAIAVEENDGETSLIRAFVSATAEAGRKLVEVHAE